MSGKFSVCPNNELRKQVVNESWAEGHLYVITDLWLPVDRQLLVCKMVQCTDKRFW